MDKPENNKKETLRLANLSSVGIALVICTLMGLGIGYWLDSILHIKPPVLTIIFMLLGIAAGFLNVFRTLAQSDTKSPRGDSDRRS
jgi:ATP synthase protein I